MLVLVKTDPMQFSAVCGKCGAREAPITGTRAEAVEHLTRLAWRVDDRFTKTAICASCAGPPSVFPAARVVADPRRCSECDRDVERCSVCNAELAVGDALSCRRSFGHAHARCSTQKMPKFVPP